MGDACSGDSGGPLLIREEGEITEFTLIATLLGGGIDCSVGQTEGEEEHGDWNKVTPHLQWIKNIIAASVNVKSEGKQALL